MSNPPTIPNIMQAIAAELVVDECFIWILSTIQDPNLQLVFSGGTSLSKGFGLIKRFSEALDSKVKIIGGYPSSKNQQRKQRKAFRDKVLDVLEEHPVDWQLDREALWKGNESSSFKVPIRYQPQFEVAQSLRPYVQLEVTFEPPALDPITKPLQSFVSQALQQKPEASDFPCVDPVETAADKLSALVWRIRTRDRYSQNDDATLVRHLHDLAALANLIQGSRDFPQLVLNCLNNDQQRGDKKVQLHPLLRLLTF